MSPRSILLCVANFSEGRRDDVIDAIVSAASGSGVRVLDVNSDPDHHRSVLSVAGPSEPLVEAMLSAAAEAARLIDLNDHRGAHPRLGSMDLVPFVPVIEATMHDAIGAARAAAKRIAEQLSIPCFLYEEASRYRDRRSLPKLRKEAFVSWAPDFGGPTQHPTAGATIVGARGLLVAFNVNLRTKDIGAAKRIANAVRNQLAHVRTMAVDLESRGAVQVSMNLVRPLETNIAKAFDMVARRTAAEGVEVFDSELVGLAPQAAFGGRDPESLGLREPPKILEDELAQAFPNSRS